MRFTFAVLASLLFMANISVSNANIIFTPTVQSTSLGGPLVFGTLFSQQTFNMRVALSGSGAAATNSVNQFAFSVTAGQSGGAINIVGGATAFTVQPTPFPFSTQFASQAEFPAGTGNGFVLFGTNQTVANGGPLINFGDGSTDRFREFSFTVVRPTDGVARDLTFTFAQAPIPGTAPTLNGFTGGAVAPFGTAFVGGTVTAVPEPTSIALVALVGGLAAGTRLRNRRSKNNHVASNV